MRPYSFGLSGRELLVLAILVGIGLAAAGTTSLVRRLASPGNIQVEQPGDIVPLPNRIEINTARDYELELLPRIGSVMARAIIAYRTEYGPFRSLEDLLNVRGIGSVTLEGLRPRAMCRPPESEGEGTDG